MRRAAEISFRLHGFYGVSVYAAIHMTVGELVRTTEELSPTRYRQIRTTTFGTLCAAGFALFTTDAAPHYDIALDDVEPSTIERLAACFGPPFPKPMA